MSLSHKKSRSGDYYTSCMTAEMLNNPNSSKLPGHRVDDYYSAGAKEPPGEWYFAADHEGKRGDFGLEDSKVFEADDVDHFHALCNGFNPNPRPGEKDKLTQNSGQKTRVALHDFTFTAPKGFSVVWSQTDEASRKQIQEAQRLSVREAMDFFSEKGAWTRQGKAGHIKTKTSFVGALFEHGSSRADDPLLHIHATVLNVCRRPDGSTGSIETMEAMRWQGAVASMYHAGLAYRFRQMGAAIKMDGKMPDVDGVPRAVIDAFSQRRKAIEQAVEQWQVEHGMTADAKRASKGLLQKAWNETRDAKNELTRDELEALWLKRGEEMGFSAQQVREVMHMGEPVEKLTPEQLLDEARAGVRALTDTDAVFKEPALFTAIAVHLCGRASVEEIKAAVEAVKPELVRAQKLVNTETGELETIYSTKEMLLVERDLVERVMSKAPKHILDKRRIEDFIKAKDAEILKSVMADIVARGDDPSDATGLAEEQKAAMRYVTMSDQQVQVIEGTAGAGKTFTSASVAELYKMHGYEVHGLSGAWAQALNLQKEAKLDSGRAIAGWLAAIERGDLKLNEKSLVLLDEAGMVGARDMRNVVKAVQDAGAKLVLMGDTLQQSSVSAGDALRVVVAKIGSVRLNIIRRQRSEEDKAAVYEFFAGQADKALARYDGRIHVEKDAESTNARIIKDWMESRARNPGKSHLILALDNLSVDDLNRRAHDARKAAGELGTDSVQLHTMDSKDKTDLVEFSVGDQVVFRVNNRGINTVDRDSMNVVAEYRSAIGVLAKLEREVDNRDRAVARYVASEARELARAERARAAGRSYEPRSYTQEKNKALAEKLELTTRVSDHLESMTAHFGANSNTYSQEVAKLAAVLKNDGSRHSGFPRAHATEMAGRTKAAAADKAEEVFNRVRGTIEGIDVNTKVLTVRTEDGKLVTIDPADKKWEHKKAGGLGLQHDYSTSMHASQGLTRDFVFVKDHFGMTRKQAGVAFSRHKENAQLYVDKEARYEAKMRETMADDWHHLDKFSDEECVGRIKTAYSRTSDKESTLDYDNWVEADGTRLHPQDDLTLQRIEEVREHLRTVNANETALPELPFQLQDFYVLKPPEAVTNAERDASRARLADEGIKGAVIIEAEKQGFITHHKAGPCSYNGKRPMDDAVVNRQRDGQAEAGAMRDRYPPILRGDDREIHIVRSGDDALALWSQRDRAGQARPTVVVAQGDVKAATSLAHVRGMLARAEKPPVVHADSKVSQKEQEADVRAASIAAKQEVRLAAEPAPKEQAKHSESVERQATQAATVEEKKRQRTLGG